MATVAILVNGIHGSGKSDLAEKLAAVLGCPVLAKDAVLEDLADIAGTTADRAALDALAMSTIWALGKAVPDGIVIDAEIADREIALRGAAVTGALRLVEVWCDLPADEARVRAEGRPRHPIHASAPASPADAAPLGLWPVVHVNTRVAVDFGQLLPELAELLP
ncbi:AAA family ATPase [Glaciihabitans sp. dw_435]|uniref:AAA family ATPase n=1 Tax=Glaciihabitans sp. dw_435 TaxID=2720081 RepID=UPI001BD2C493|nr:AAA family ATPase [Glaciihabitans sp. dw_435]